MLERFNPCYAGSKIESHSNIFCFDIDPSFNPCYAGSKIESPLVFALIL